MILVSLYWRPVAGYGLRVAGYEDLVDWFFEDEYEDDDKDETSLYRTRALVFFNCVSLQKSTGRG
jgi:hypothetical protein